MTKKAKTETISVANNRHQQKVNKHPNGKKSKEKTRRNSKENLANLKKKIVEERDDKRNVEALKRMK